MKWLRFFSGYYYLEYLLLRGLARLINLLPILGCHTLAAWGGDLLFFLARRRRKIALSNLDLAFKNSKSRTEKEAIARESFRHLVISLVEFFRIPKFLKEASRHFRFQGLEHLDRALAKGKGVIFAVSHFGAWEYLAFVFHLKGYPCAAVTQPMKNPYVDAWIQAIRETTSLIPLNKRGAARAALSELRANHLVAILIDQWASSDGIWVEFFGERTSTTSVPVRLARLTGSVLVPGFCIRRGPEAYEIQIMEEVPIQGDESSFERETTHALNQILERQIRAFPSQWMWAHRRWKGYEHYQALKALRAKKRHSLSLSERHFAASAVK